MFKSIACDPIYEFVGCVCGVFVCARKKKWMWKRNNSLVSNRK